MSVLVVDKPVGPTSFAVVRRVRDLLRRLDGRKAKVGHGGTLDPLASGVLPVCIGEATKLAPFLLDADKEYEAEVRFGVTTDTLDAAGKVLSEASVAGLDQAAVSAALPRFRGAIDQVPPMYSALKRAGRPLYEYARQGLELPRAARPVVVHELELLAWEPPATARLRVACSKGTYVRSLAADLGAALGPGAHLTALRRTVSGPFTLGQAIGLEEAEARVDRGEGLPLVSLADALAHLPAATPSEAIAWAIGQGQRVPRAALALPPEASGQARLLRPDGSLLAVVRLEQEIVRPVRIFAASTGPL
jgi:tRNA pseudouridine55 synthase